MRTKTRPRPHLEVVPVQDATVQPDAIRLNDQDDPCCGAARRTEGALLHLQIALRTYSCGLPVDWSHVAVRMGQTLLAVDADEAHP